MKYLSLSLVLAISLAMPVFADYYYYGVGDDGGELDPWWIWDVLEPFPEWKDDPIHRVIRNNWDADDAVGGPARDSVYDDLLWYANNLDSGDLFIYQHQCHGGWDAPDLFVLDEGNTPRPLTDDPDPANSPYEGDEFWGYSGSTYLMLDDYLRYIFDDFDSCVEVIVIHGMCHAGGLIGGSYDLDTSAPATNNGLFAALACPEQGYSIGWPPGEYWPALQTWAFTNTLEPYMTMSDWFEAALEYGETHQISGLYYWPAEDWVPSDDEKTWDGGQWGWWDTYWQLRPISYSTLDAAHDHWMGTPEPGTIALFGLGLAALGARLRRRKTS